ncbi:GPW/gp25 family protein [Terasakiella sp.]|uniref:GPW/gp25 family protein n=1 Tax=Terasakiella sp. TaxID=2034861 RepID=UPI003AA8F756
MKGINSKTGKSLSGLDHLRQSIVDILTTPIGSRVMRRTYGSRLPELVDAPINKQTLLDMYAATAQALKKWEPRFSLQNVQAVSAAPGKLTISLTGKYLPDGVEITLDGIEVR